MVDGVIDSSMSDKENIKAVSLYVLNNLKYDIKKTLESNENPLGCSLDDGKVVCASYAYFTNVLLNKAGVDSFLVKNDNHGWNIVK